MKMWRSMKMCFFACTFYCSAKVGKRGRKERRKRIFIFYFYEEYYDDSKESRIQMKYSKWIHFIWILEYFNSIGRGQWSLAKVEIVCTRMQGTWSHSFLAGESFSLTKKTHWTYGIWYSISIVPTMKDVPAAFLASKETQPVKLERKVSHTNENKSYRQKKQKYTSYWKILCSVVKSIKLILKSDVSIY